MFKFPFQFCKRCMDFDRKGFAREHLLLKPKYLPIPHLEDYCANYANEHVVLKRLWSWFTLSQIVSFSLNVNINGVQEEDENILDPIYIESSPLLISEID